MFNYYRSQLGSIIHVERTTSIFINSISELLPQRIGFELNDMQTEYRKKNHCGLLHIPEVNLVEMLKLQ